MNSFNHYSLGSVGAWLYSGAAGIQPDDASPGYKHFLLAPQFTTRLSYVKATLDSPYGAIASAWRTSAAVRTNGRNRPCAPASSARRIAASSRTDFFALWYAMRYSV